MKTCNSGHLRLDGEKRCRQCNIEYHRKNYRDNKEKVLAQNKKWDSRNRKKINERLKKWRKKNPSDVREQRQRRKELHPLEGIFRSMVDRCYNTKCHAYKDYGGRGITVCDRWRGRGSLQRFEQDMNPRPSPRHTLERVDNNKGYSPGNCTWATRDRQASNRRGIKLVTINGRTQHKAAWAREIGISQTAFNTRISKGWTGEKLLQAASPNASGGFFCRERRTERLLLALYEILGDAEYSVREEVEELLRESKLIGGNDLAA